MSAAAARLAVSLAKRLPLQSLNELADAAGKGAPGLVALRSQSGTSALRDACTALIRRIEQGDHPSLLAGSLLTALHARQDMGNWPTVETVWTGPDSGSTTRLTLAVVADLIASAEAEILLASYATYPSKAVVDALADAAARKVQITLLLERPEDNPKFEGIGDPFPELVARRLCWPENRRRGGSSMHAKFLAVDRTRLLAGSANLTGKALETNLEMGVLIHDPTLVTDLVTHVERLVSSRELQEP